MEHFTPEDAWAITKKIQLSNVTRKKRQQIDAHTKHRMLTQWDWWRTNYIDEADNRGKQVPLGPTRKLLDVIDQDPLVRQKTSVDIATNERRAQRRVSLGRYKYESKRAHQLALTNAACSTRLIESTTSNAFMGKEMERMANGKVCTRAGNEQSRESLRATISSLSVLDFVPEDLKLEKMPTICIPCTAAEKKQRKRNQVRMLYLDRNKTVPFVDMYRQKTYISLSSSGSVYTPDLESTSTKSFPMTMESLTPKHAVVTSKVISTLWRNPVGNPVKESTNDG